MSGPLPPSLLLWHGAFQPRCFLAVFYRSVFSWHSHAPPGVGAPSADFLPVQLSGDFAASVKWQPAINIDLGSIYGKEKLWHCESL